MGVLEPPLPGLIIGLCWFSYFDEVARVVDVAGLQSRYEIPDDFMNFQAWLSVAWGSHSDQLYEVWLDLLSKVC